MTVSKTLPGFFFFLPEGKEIWGSEELCDSPVYGHWIR